MKVTIASSPVALVTGAGGGLGQGLVAEFLSQGWRVAAVCRHRQPYTETDRLWPVTLDVTERADVQEVLEGLVSRSQRLDALVNNAGLIADEAVWQLSDAQWQRLLEVNLKAAVLCAQATLPTMVRQGRGHILNISSFSARSGPRGQAGYAAAKAGLIGFTQALAREVGPHNLCVNAILPGVLPTPMTAGLPKRVWEDFVRQNVLGRINSVAEVARFVVFLAGLSNISGQIFQLDSRIGRWV